MNDIEITKHDCYNLLYIIVWGDNDMEEKINVLYAKEAEYTNLSAKAQTIHEERIAKEAELAEYKDIEAVK